MTMQSSPPSHEKIAIRDLKFFYGDHKALKDINLSLAEKKVTA